MLMMKNKNVDTEPELIFPVVSSKLEHDISLQQIIALSEKSLPYQNKKRRKSEALTYTMFKL